MQARDALAEDEVKVEKEEIITKGGGESKYLIT